MLNTINYVSTSPVANTYTRAQPGAVIEFNLIIYADFLVSDNGFYANI